MAKRQYEQEELEKHREHRATEADRMEAQDTIARALAATANDPEVQAWREQNGEA